MYAIPLLVIFLCISFFPHHNMLDMFSMVLAPLRFIAYAVILLYPNRNNNPLFFPYNCCIWLPPALAFFLHDGLRMYILFKSLKGHPLPVPYDTELFQLKTGLTWLAILIVYWTKIQQHPNNAALLQQTLYNVTFGYRKEHIKLMPTGSMLLAMPSIPPMQVFCYGIGSIMSSTSASAPWTLVVEQHGGSSFLLFCCLAMLQPVSSGLRALFLLLQQHQHELIRWTPIKNILFTTVCYCVIHFEAVLTSRIIRETVDGNIWIPET